MAKLGYALHATPTANDMTCDTIDISETAGLNTISRTAKSFWEYKQFVCGRFARGVEILKNKPAMLDHYGVVMVLTALASGKSWDDADRMDGEVFGPNTNCDTFGALAENMVAGCSRKTIVDNQALCIAVGNTRDDTEVHTIPAAGILVLAAVGHNVAKDNAMVPLYSKTFFEGFAVPQSREG